MVLEFIPRSLFYAPSSLLITVPPIFSPSSLPYTGQQTFYLGFSISALGRLPQVSSLCTRIPPLCPAPPHHCHWVLCCTCICYSAGLRRTRGEDKKIKHPKMSPPGRKMSYMLLGKSRGQLQIAPERMNWLDQSGNFKEG